MSSEVCVYTAVSSTQRTQFERMASEVDEGVPGEAESLAAVSGLSPEAFDYVTALSAQEFQVFVAKCVELRQHQQQPAASAGWELLRDQRQDLATQERVLLALKGVPFFSALDDAVVADMVANLESRTFADAQSIVEKGDVADGLYIVLDGSAAVFVDGATVHTYGAGESFGEQAMIDAAVDPAATTVRNATIRSSGGQCLAVRLGVDQFRRLDKGAVKIGRAMSKMAVKAREAEQAARRDAAAKLAGLAAAPWQPLIKILEHSETVRHPDHALSAPPSPAARVGEASSPCCAATGWDDWVPACGVALVVLRLAWQAGHLKGKNAAWAEVVRSLQVRHRPSRPASSPPAVVLPEIPLRNACFCYAF
jgi:CRP-like cAMP-binding protein